jgi:hypothetical protein
MTSTALVATQGRGGGGGLVVSRDMIWRLPGKLVLSECRRGIME